MPDGSASQDAIYRARPTLRFGGQFDERAGNLVQRMVMDESEGGLRALELVLSNWASTTDGSAELAFDQSRNVRLGGPIEVFGGEVARPCELFRGHITAIETILERGKPPELRLCAEDALLSARLARRSRVFTDQAPSAVVRALCGDLGLTPVLSGLDAPTASWAQIDETDLAFLRRLLARFDADAQVVGTDLHVSPRADVQRAQISIDAEHDLRAIRVCADLAEQATAVVVRGWDPSSGRAVKAQASAISNAGPGEGRDGAGLLRDAFGDRPDNLGHLAVSQQEEAQALAEAAFDRRARRFVRAVGVTEGNPNLRVGVRLVMRGLGARFDNEYYVVRTRHCYDTQQGYSTEFCAECAYLGGSQ
ncbi:phage late control D family protein [Montanilutibacter psychrotolerans]|uniref:Phage late control D family protein n=1 Tax=Montanilutibacter psychrotolerans TaxID=1327343 RepID=A0A3M8T3Z9_9GAMM|nr:contractile injection system protein, VgrG/Pvc8 family [Lysobacter psychrotolerans]RNF86194.1 phage late control D family protein [Lysobacter psychrotolerans]